MEVESEVCSGAPELRMEVMTQLLVHLLTQLSTLLLEHTEGESSMLLKKAHQPLILAVGRQFLPMSLSVLNSTLDSQPCHSVVVPSFA